MVADLGGKIARNAVFSVIGRLFLLVAWALITPYMLRVLGDERFALWALFFAISGYFIAFDLGVSQAVVKFVAQFAATEDPRALRGIVTLGTLAYTALALPVVLGLLVFRDPILDLMRTPETLRPEAGWSLIGMGFVFGANNLVQVMTSVLTGRQRQDVTTRILIVGTVLQVGGAIGALATGWGLRGLVATYGIGVVVMGLLSWFAIRAIAPEARFDLGALRRGQVRDLMGFSSALQVINVGTFLQFHLPKFLLAHFTTFALVTRFELALRLALAAWAAPVLLLHPLVPAVSHLGSLADHERVLRLYLRASRYVAAVSFPIAGFVLAAAPALITAWLGPGYPDVAWVAAGLIAFLLLIMQGGVAATVCRGIGEPWIEARYHIVGAAVLIAMAFWCIPRWGLAGALAALGVSGLITMVLFVRHLHARIGQSTLVWFRSAIAVPLLASALATALAIAWRGGPLVMPEGRVAALADIGRTAVVFVVLVAGSYLTTRFITTSELREVARRAAIAP